MNMDFSDNRLQEFYKIIFGKISLNLKGTPVLVSFSTKLQAGITIFMIKIPWLPCPWKEIKSFANFV